MARKKEAVTEAVEGVSGDIVYTVKTNANGLNLRKMPSKEADIIRLIPNGELVKVNDKADAPPGWVAVVGGGYVMKEYLE